jgi:hypothetical protein
MHPLFACMLLITMHSESYSSSLEKLTLPWAAITQLNVRNDNADRKCCKFVSGYLVG